MYLCIIYSTCKCIYGLFIASAIVYTGGVVLGREANFTKKAKCASAAAVGGSAECGFLQSCAAFVAGVVVFVHYL